MLSLTRKTDYALVAMTHLARSKPGRVSAREIGLKFRLPLPALTNVLNRLARRGLIVSTRGVKGGYHLGREPEQISIAEVIEAIEGPFKLTACCGDSSVDDDEACIREGLCPVSDPLRKVHGIVEHILGQITLRDVAMDNVSLPASLAPAARMKQS